MQFTVDRYALDAALHYAAKYVKTRTSIPVLSTVLLRTNSVHERGAGARRC